MSLEMAVLTAHVPSICHEENTPEYQKELVAGMHKIGQMIDEKNADVVVLMSCHFPATFNLYVDVSPRRQGVLTAVECPDLISEVPYNYEGDTELANQLVEAGKQAGVPVIGFNDPTYVLDYGTLVPLRYLVPKENIPVIGLSVCLSSNIDEAYNWGLQIGKKLRESNKRAVFVSSGALSHNVVRGRENMPTLSEQAMDNQFIDYLLKGDYAAAKQMLPQYARISGVESRGCHLATLLGVVEDEYKATFLGYAQSSGSGNANVTFTR